MNHTEFCVHYCDCDGFYCHRRVQVRNSQEAVDSVRRDDRFCTVLFVAQVVGGWE